MQTLRFLCLALLTLASARAQEPQWIWHTDKSDDGEVRFFRKTFTLAEPATAAEVIVSGDNTAQVFINGTEAGHAKDWRQPARARVEKQLKVGENVIAIRGANEDGVAAVVARLTIDTAKGKGALIVVTDMTWLSSEKGPAGWEKPGFAAADWGKPISRGKLGMGPWGDVFAGGGKTSGGKAPATALKTSAGFKAELIRTAEPGEGSWVSMTVDPQNRLIVCSQNKPAPGWGGLLRLTLGADGKVAKTEQIETPIGEAMGLLWAFDSLYVDGQGPKGRGLYRLRFQNDQPAGEAEFLLKGAGGEHGSHGIVLGPDKALYSVAGNHTKMPEGLLPGGVLKGWAEDHLLPRQWDAGGHATGILAPGGYVLRSTDQGKTWATFCGSFRNSYDIAFNADGELFTFDSDMEWDIGTPWYRPTRINHCVSGGEYGWRSGTSNQPAYYFDSLPAACDIGIGSPTGCEFGTAAKGWPEKYQRALYAMDWANGKIFAYHPVPAGATYGGPAEVFVEGKPLNVTDLTFVNGTMYFTCGGRGTQAALYRVTYDGPPAAGPVPAPDLAAAKARELRRQLEVFHGNQDPKAVETAWPHLDSPDRFIRWAARTAIEFQPFESWKQRALGEKRTWASLEAMLALVRSCPKDQAKALSPHLCEGITTLPIEQMSEDQLLAAIRLTGLVFTRLGAPTEDERRQMTDLWTRFFPQQKTDAKDTPLNWIAPGPGQVRASQSVNRELSQLLVFLDAPGTVGKTMALLRDAPGQEEQLHYAFVLRNGQQYASPGEKKPAGPLTGWTPQLRTEYFAWLAKAAAQYSGGASFKKFIANLKKDALETLSDADKLALADKPSAPVPPATGASPGHPRGFVKAWEMAELLPLVKDGKGDKAKGKKHFTEAQCALCHRFGTEGGALGPDLTAAGSRFNRRDMLEAIIEPNKVVSDQYRNSVITVKGGKEIIGRQVDDTATKIAIAENPFTNDRTEISKADITKRDLSPASSMPPGLINLFTKEEIIDLLTYLESGGK